MTNAAGAGLAQVNQATKISRPAVLNLKLSKKLLISFTELSDVFIGLI